MIIAIVTLLSITSSAFNALEYSLNNPVYIFDITRASPITANTEQISCEHLDFRYSVMKSILTDMAWLSTLRLDVIMDSKVTEYIYNRTKIDIKNIADKAVFEVEFSIPQTIIEDLGVASLGVLHSVRFEQLLNETSSGTWSSTEKTKNNLIFKTKLNTFDICQKGHIDVLLFSNCIKDQASEDMCNTHGICPSLLVADWLSCKEIKNIRVQTQSLKKLLGKRNLVIKRGSEL